jgi:hemerythrin-like domain-containing protein
MRPFDTLTEQHRELEERFAALEAEDGADAAGEQREQAEALIALLRLHTRLEERHLYPLLEREQGQAWAHVEAEEHLTMRELIDELEEQTLDGPEWWARLVALEDLVLAHVRKEESQLFPLLSAALNASEQAELRRALDNLRAELSAPAGSWPPSLSTFNEPSWDV